MKERVIADVLTSRQDRKTLSSMLSVNVVLPNGHAEHLTLLPSSTVHDLRTKAQRAFGKKYLRLITAKNRVLVNFEQTLEEAEIEDGECLTALVLQPQLAATESAFALWCHGDSAIVTWGDAECHGGDSSAVRDQLKGVAADSSHRSKRPLLRFWKMDQSLPGVIQAMVVTVRQFEISSRVCSRFKPQVLPLLRFLEDGSVVTWGHADFDMAVTVRQFEISSGVCSRFKPLIRAFAAILADGSVVTWGDAELWR